jgi:hypothetical protein
MNLTENTRALSRSTRTLQLRNKLFKVQASTGKSVLTLKGQSSMIFMSDGSQPTMQYTEHAT